MNEQLIEFVVKKLSCSKSRVFGKPKKERKRLAQDQPSIRTTRSITGGESASGVKEDVNNDNSNKIQADEKFCKNKISNLSRVATSLSDSTVIIHLDRHNTSSTYTVSSTLSAATTATATNTNNNTNNNNAIVKQLCKNSQHLCVAANAATRYNRYYLRRAEPLSICKNEKATLGSERILLIEDNKQQYKTNLINQKLLQPALSASNTNLHLYKQQEYINRSKLLSENTDQIPMMETVAINSPVPTDVGDPEGQGTGANQVLEAARTCGVAARR